MMKFNYISRGGNSVEVIADKRAIVYSIATVIIIMYCFLLVQWTSGNLTLKDSVFAGDWFEIIEKILFMGGSFIALVFIFLNECYVKLIINKNRKTVYVHTIRWLLKNETHVIAKRDLKIRCEEDKDSDGDWYYRVYLMLPKRQICLEDFNNRAQMTHAAQRLTNLLELPESYD